MTQTRGAGSARYLVAIKRIHILSWQQKIEPGSA
nr:MAG TPA: hypothetical protein [Caudoviricetes sp.]